MKIVNCFEESYVNAFFPISGKFPKTIIEIDNENVKS